MQMFKVLLIFGLLFAFDISSIEANQWKQNYFIITFWSPPPPTMEALSIASKEGFNLTWTDDLDWSDDYGLNAVHGQRMRAILQNNLLTPSTLDNPEKRMQLDALIDRVKKHPSLEAYYIADEPNAADFPGLGRLVAYLRARDPNHFAYINLYPIYATNKQLGTKGSPIEAYQEYLQKYINEVKPSLISYDHYHFFKAGDRSQYFLNLELIQQAAQKHGLPFMNIIQASTIVKAWRLVNADELRWLVYTTLAYGGRGISYFLYWGPPEHGGLYRNGVRTPLVDAVTVLNKEIAAQGPILMNLINLGTYHTYPLPIGAKPVPMSSPVSFVGPGDFVIGFFGTSATITAFMVVNRNYKIQTTAQIALKKDIRGVEEFDKAAMTWKKQRIHKKEHSITVNLKPGDGRLFRIVRYN